MNHKQIIEDLEKLFVGSKIELDDSDDGVTVVNISKNSETTD